MQQSLPFTVLKPYIYFFEYRIYTATVATVLTVYGIETLTTITQEWRKQQQVATVLTVYGIETYYALRNNNVADLSCNSPYRLRY